jgi:hypothetical protein
MLDDVMMIFGSADFGDTQESYQFVFAEQTGAWCKTAIAVW